MVGHLDCAHCDVASERAALEKWIRANYSRPSMSSAWKIFQHGKASAIPPGFKLVKIEAASAVPQVHVHAMSTVSLTFTQDRVLTFIKAHITNQGRPPTRQDIATHFGWKSPNAAEDHLKRIADKGFIVLHPGRACGIEVVAP
jgi:hypothetical protein